MHYFGAKIIFFFIVKLYIMLTMNEFFLFFVFAGVILFWLDTTSKREIAYKHSFKLAKQFNLQLLDDSIHCSKLALVKTVNLPKIKRVYRFTVSSNNDDRMQCHLILIGATMVSWYIPPYPQIN